MLFKRWKNSWSKEGVLVLNWENRIFLFMHVRLLRCEVMLKVYIVHWKCETELKFFNYVNMHYGKLNLNTTVVYFCVDKLTRYSISQFTLRWHVCLQYSGSVYLRVAQENTMNTSDTGRWIDFHFSFQAQTFLRLFFNFVMDCIWMNSIYANLQIFWMHSVFADILFGYILEKRSKNHWLNFKLNGARNVFRFVVFVVTYCIASCSSPTIFIINFFLAPW